LFLDCFFFISCHIHFSPLFCFFPFFFVLLLFLLFFCFCILFLSIFFTSGAAAGAPPVGPALRNIVGPGVAAIIGRGATSVVPVIVATPPATHIRSVLVSPLPVTCELTCPSAPKCARWHRNDRRPTLRPRSARPRCRPVPSEKLMNSHSPWPGRNGRARAP